jgi:hypothetical protein
MVSDSLRDLNAFQPPFFTLRHTPNMVSMNMARMAINTIGCTGASIVTNEAVKIKRLFFIR